MTDKKIVIEKTIKCPHCQQLIDIKHTKTTIEKGYKGIYDHEIESTKSLQTTLQQEEKT